MESEQIKTIVTKRDDTANVVAFTPNGLADIVTVPMTMLTRILIRSSRVYMQSLVGIMSAGGLGLDKGILPNDFGDLLWAASGLSLAPAVMSALQNLLEFLTKLDESHPQIRG